jgi:hypothetical protein
MTETSPNVQNKLDQKCEHPEAGLIPSSKGELNVIEFAYCPQCGAKL